MLKLKGNFLIESKIIIQLEYNAGMFSLIFF